ncbi:MAG: hypothetical protein KGJ80_07475 [Chloroflexota bacterium]|nr:hypothetical protein [Chloroflexota bacterium]
MATISEIIEEKTRLTVNGQFDFPSWTATIQRLIGEIEDSITHRPLIVYAADITKSHPAAPNLIYPLDKTMFSELLDSVTVGDGIDILIQSPGGLAESAENLVEMIRSKFASVRYFVPHTAKSAATMMVCSGDEIWMDNTSELGPIDPQIFVPKGSGMMVQVPAQAYLDGFQEALELIEKKGVLSPGWIPVLSQVDVATMNVCKTAKDLSNKLVRQWLIQYMLKGDAQRRVKARKIVEFLGSYKKHKSHGRAISLSQARTVGLNVQDFGSNAPLRDKVRELYNRIELTFDGMRWVKLFISRSYFVGKLVPG